MMFLLGLVVALVIKKTQHLRQNEMRSWLHGPIYLTATCIGGSEQFQANHAVQNFIPALATCRKAVQGEDLRKKQAFGREWLLTA